MDSPHIFRLASQDKQLFSFGKKFFGKKLDQIRDKKDYIQILREKGLIDYLDRKIINKDLEKMNRFSKKASDIQKIVDKTNIQKNSKYNGSSGVTNDVGSRTNHFRNIRNPTKPKIMNEKNYINNILIKPKYQHISHKFKAKQLLSENAINLKSMPLILLSEDNVDPKQRIATLNNYSSFNELPLFDLEFLNQSKSFNQIMDEKNHIIDEKNEIKQKMEYVKNFLGKESIMFKIRKPIRRGTSIR